MKEKIKIAVSGVGNRALPKNPAQSNWLGWMELIRQSKTFELCGIHDPSPEALSRAIERKYAASEQTYHDLDVLFKRSGCQALLITNPAEFHSSTIRKAIANRIPILVEKPLTNDVREGEDLLDTARRNQVTVAVVHNWRSKAVGLRLKQAISEGLIGPVGHIFFRYVRDRENAQYPSYIFAEKYPLLYAMGIHHLDLFRFILDDEIEFVSGQSFKPSWSLYQSDTGVNLFLRSRKGASIIYTGTISSPNRVLSQESLLIEGAKGTLVNESQWLEPPLWFFPKGKNEKVNLTKEIAEPTMAAQYNFSDQTILENFYLTLTQGAKPICSGVDGLQSVRLLEAAREACETGKTIFLDPVPV